VELKGHTVRPTGKKIPEDFQMFFKLLQRNIPLEIFDPDKTSMETTYLDGDLRINNICGERFQNVRNIFSRTTKQRQ